MSNITPQDRKSLFDQMKITTRLIAEEALRRGYDINYFRGGRTITGLLTIITPKGKVLVKSSVGTLTRGYGVFVAENKLLMARLFASFGIRTPKTLFYSGDVDEAEAFVREHKQIVVKPLDTNHGTGITVGVSTNDELHQALARAERVSSRGALMQQMVQGIDHRLLVVGDRLVAAAYRKPALVTGDGTHTIRELIVAENQNPLRGQGHSAPLTLLDETAAKRHLAPKGASLDDIPAQGQEVALAGVANLSQGGSAVDVTDDVHPTVAAMAVHAAKVAGLGVAGVDVMCTDITKPLDQSDATIIELNESPGIRMHHFPSVGKPRDVASAILDQALEHGEYL